MMVVHESLNGPKPILYLMIDPSDICSGMSRIWNCVHCGVRPPRFSGDEKKLKSDGTILQEGQHV